MPPQTTYSIGCGGTFTTPNGLFTSPSYPHNYPTEADCNYIISQPPNMYISIKILLVDISDEKDSQTRWNDYRHYKHVTCDMAYLEVRDGPSNQSPLIDGYCANSTVLSIPLYLQSTQNDVFIR